MKQIRSPYFFSTLLAILVMASACTPAAQATPIPALPQATDTRPPAPTRTERPTSTPRPTITPDVAATQAYEEFSVWVEKLFDQGYISSTEGEFIPLDDYSDSLAQTEYYQWVTYEELHPRNFILQANVKITNAAPNTTKAGCGFVYGESNNPALIIFSQDGNINYYYGIYNRRSNYLDATLFDDPDGLLLTLLIDEEAGGLRFFVNDRMGLYLEGVGGYTSDIGPAVLSGTDVDFGTRCDFTDMVLWNIQ